MSILVLGVNKEVCCAALYNAGSSLRAAVPGGLQEASPLAEAAGGKVQGGGQGLQMAQPLLVCHHHPALNVAGSWNGDTVVALWHELESRLQKVGG